MGREGWNLKDKYTKRGERQYHERLQDESYQIYSSCRSSTKPTYCCVVGYCTTRHGQILTIEVDPTALMMDDEREPPKQSIEFVVVT